MHQVHHHYLYMVSFVACTMQLDHPVIHVSKRQQ
jgi:hypothetical protein